MASAGAGELFLGSLPWRRLLHGLNGQSLASLWRVAPSSSSAIGLCNRPRDRFGLLSWLGAATLSIGPASPVVVGLPLGQEVSSSTIGIYVGLMSHWPSLWLHDGLVGWALASLVIGFIALWRPFGLATASIRACQQPRHQIIQYCGWLSVQPHHVETKTGHMAGLLVAAASQRHCRV